nr:parathyroid hormone-related protein-like [Nerophis lumbriciformis]
MSRSGVRGFFLAFFLLCSPVPDRAGPVAGAPPPQRPAARMRRSVTHAQLMHDKGRTLQDFKRRMWLQELLDEVHTAEIRQPAEDARPKDPAGSKDFGPEEAEAGGPPRETNETLRDGKRRKKGGAGKRKDGDKRKRRARSAPLGPGDWSGWRPAL